MRILFLALAFPLPANNGYKMRTWALLRALASEGHKVTLLTFAHPEEVDDNHAQVQQVCIETHLVPLELRSLSATGDYFRRFRAIFSTYPYSVQRFRSRTMEQRINTHLANETFDAVVSDTIFSAVNLVPTSIPLILNAPDVEHEILQRYLAFERNPARRFYASLESRKVRNWERAACRRATLCMACSERDRSILQALCASLPIMVVPNVVDTDRYVPGREDNSLTVLYQGGMDWYPNRDAVEFFVSAILPALQRLVPGVKFVVAGRSPSGDFRRRFARIPAVEFTGTVEDMRRELARAALCVVPLRIGSGTRLKILEAAAMGNAIVSTSLGAEGLNFVAEQDILIEDEPQAFARAVAMLLNDPRRRSMLGGAARRRVERYYSFEVLRTSIRSVLALLEQERPATKAC